MGNGKRMLAGLMQPWLALVLASVMAAAVFPAAASEGKRQISAKGEQCVESTDYMRRNHMELLKHHRNETMRQGIRTTKHSLKGCVECHASEKTGSVAAGKEDFCVSCHTWTAVHLDCWDCHATKPGKKTAKGVAQ